VAVGLDNPELAAAILQPFALERVRPRAAANELLHNFLHNPRRRPLTRGIISNFSTRRGEMAAKLQSETSRFLAEFT
jgi:hypothetical protein